MQKDLAVDSYIQNSVPRIEQRFLANSDEHDIISTKELHQVQDEAHRAEDGAPLIQYQPLRHTAKDYTRDLIRHDSR